MNHSCRVAKRDITRREIKQTNRKGSIAFGVIFTVLIGAIMYGYLSEMNRKECEEVKEYSEIQQVSTIIIMSSTLICTYMIINLLLTVCTLVAKSKHLKADPEYLSSDEEDDQVFINGARP